MQYRVGKMAVILDEMDVMFVEGCAPYCVQQTVRITRNIAVTSRPSTRWHAYISKKPHEDMASYPSMQCATSLIKSNAVNSASTSHYTFNERFGFPWSASCWKRFIIITISILLLQERYTRQAWEPSNKAILFMTPMRTGENKRGNVRIT